MVRIRRRANDSTERRRKAVKLFANEVAAEKLAIVQLKHLDTRLTKETTQSISERLADLLLGVIMSG